LRLLHPFTPFVTEELWQHLKSATLDSPLARIAADWPEVLMIATWPEPQENEGWETEIISDFELIKEVIRSIRNLRSEKNVKPGTRISAIFSAGEKTNLIKDQISTIALLAKLDESQITIHQSLNDKPVESSVQVVGEIEIFLPLAGMVDITEERTRMEKEFTEAKSQIARLEKLLDSPFVEKAPPNVVKGERDRLANYKETAKKLENQLTG
jgi:valyl-tRNA synthetase